MFKLLKIENARENVPSPAFYEVTAGEAVAEGEALVLASGKLTKCTATTKPQFIAMGDKAAAAENRQLAVCRPTPGMLFEVPITAAPTSLKAGDLVTLHTDGLQITATTTGGVVFIENLNGASAIGDSVIVRIV